MTKSLNWIPTINKLKLEVSMAEDRLKQAKAPQTDPVKPPTPATGLDDVLHVRDYYNRQGAVSPKPATSLGQETTPDFDSGELDYNTFRRNYFNSKGWKDWGMYSEAGLQNILNKMNAENYPITQDLVPTLKSHEDEVEQAYRQAHGSGTYIQGQIGSMAEAAGLVATGKLINPARPKINWYDPFYDVGSALMLGKGNVLNPAANAAFAVGGIGNAVANPSPESIAFAALPAAGTALGLRGAGSAVQKWAKEMDALVKENRATKGIKSFVQSEVGAIRPFWVRNSQIESALIKLSDNEIKALDRGTKGAVGQSLGISGKADEVSIDNYLIRVKNALKSETGAIQPEKFVPGQGGFKKGSIKPDKWFDNANDQSIDFEQINKPSEYATDVLAGQTRKVTMQGGLKKGFNEVDTTMVDAEDFPTREMYYLADDGTVKGYVNMAYNPANGWQIDDLIIDPKIGSLLKGKIALSFKTALAKYNVKPPVQGTQLSNESASLVEKYRRTNPPGWERENIISEPFGLGSRKVRYAKPESGQGIQQQIAAINARLKEPNLDELTRDSLLERRAMLTKSLGEIKQPTAAKPVAPPEPLKVQGKTYEKWTQISKKEDRALSDDYYYKKTVNGKLYARSIKAAMKEEETAKSFQGMKSYKELPPTGRPEPKKAEVYPESLRTNLLQALGATNQTDFMVQAGHIWDYLKYDPSRRAEIIARYKRFLNRPVDYANLDWKDLLIEERRLLTNKIAELSPQELAAKAKTENLIDQIDLDAVKAEANQKVLQARRQVQKIRQKSGLAEPVVVKPNREATQPSAVEEIPVEEMPPDYGQEMVVPNIEDLKAAMKKTVKRNAPKKPVAQTVSPKFNPALKEAMTPKEINAQFEHYKATGELPPYREPVKNQKGRGGASRGQKQAKSKESAKQVNYTQEELAEANKTIEEFVKKNPPKTGKTPTGDVFGQIIKDAEADVAARAEIEASATGKAAQQGYEAALSGATPDEISQAMKVKRDFPIGKFPKDYYSKEKQDIILEKIRKKQIDKNFRATHESPDYMALRVKNWFLGKTAMGQPSRIREASEMIGDVVYEIDQAQGGKLSKAAGLPPATKPGGKPSGTTPVSGKVTKVKPVATTPTEEPVMLTPEGMGEVTPADLQAAFNDLLTEDIGSDMAGYQGNMIKLKSLPPKIQRTFRENMRRLGINALDTFNIPRVILASFDVSAPLRQGIFPTLAHPDLAADSMGKMFRALFSEKYAARIQEELLARPTVKKLVEHGLEMTDWRNIQPTLKGKFKMEESFMSTYMQNLWGIRASNRAYVTYLNQMRARVGEMGMKYLEGKGLSGVKRELDSLANYLNLITGRGKYPKGSFAAASSFMNQLFFAPKLQFSRIEMAGQILPFVGSKWTRAQARRDWLILLTFGASAMALAQLAGAKITTDARDTDFGMIRIGDTRLNVWGGFAQYARFLWRLRTGETSTGGKVSKSNFLNELTRFIQGKASPPLSLALDVAARRDYVGNPIEYTPRGIANQVYQRTFPLSWQDTMSAIMPTFPYENSNSWGIKVSPKWASQLAATWPTFLGAGASTYPPKASETPALPTKRSVIPGVGTNRYRNSLIP